MTGFSSASSVEASPRVTPLPPSASTRSNDSGDVPKNDFATLRRFDAAHPLPRAFDPFAVGSTVVSISSNDPSAASNATGSADTSTCTWPLLIRNDREFVVRRSFSSRTRSAFGATSPFGRCSRLGTPSDEVGALAGSFSPPPSSRPQNPTSPDSCACSSPGEVASGLPAAIAEPGPPTTIVVTRDALSPEATSVLMR